jgi:hypothetical protein
MLLLQSSAASRQGQQVMMQENYNFSRVKVAIRKHNFALKVFVYRYKLSAFVFILCAFFLKQFKSWH